MFSEWNSSDKYLTRWTCSPAVKPENDEKTHSWRWNRRCWRTDDSWREATCLTDQSGLGTRVCVMFGHDSSFDSYLFGPGRFVVVAGRLVFVVVQLLLVLWRPRRRFLLLLQWHQVRSLLLQLPLQSLGLPLLLDLLPLVFLNVGQRQGSLRGKMRDRHVLPPSWHK